MNALEKIGIVLFIFMIFTVFVAVARHKKQEGEWLNPGWYIKNIFEGLSIFIYSAMGSPASLKGLKVTPGDSKFITLSTDLHEQALKYAHDQMIKEGIVYHSGDENRKVKPIGSLGYCRRLFDCENFAYALKHYHDLYVARETCELGAGIPSMVIEYTKDNGHGHSIVQFEVNNITTWRDCYPKNGTFKQLNPSADEKASISYVGRG